MRRITSICLLLLSAVAMLATAPAAFAAKAKAKASASAPQITRVLPMRVRVGGTFTITGKHFRRTRTANTVIFRSARGRSAFTKPRRVGPRKLVVVVPGSVTRLLTVRDGNQRPTRLKLRVLAGKFSKFTPRRLSPVITSANSGNDGPGADPVPCNTGGADGDHDGDLLSNTLERSIKTDPCLRDTDLDGVEDGYEQQVALDLNRTPGAPSLPYPGSRPYANALDPSDADVDFDGDGLRLSDEFRLWLRYSSDGAVRPARPDTLGNLLYSDGFQSSRIVAAPAAGTLLAWSLDLNDDGALRDDERDGDNDGLGNWDESTGRMTEAWWPAQHNGTAEPKESAYPGINFLDNADTHNAMVDPDMDGDGVLDGSDDADRDGVSNMFEVRRPVDWQADAWPVAGPPSNSWAYTNPFNPCKPFNSARCHAHPPFGYYDGDGVPPIGPAQSGAGPQPTTPNG